LRQKNASANEQETGQSHRHGAAFLGLQFDRLGCVRGACCFHVCVHPLKLICLFHFANFLDHIGHALGIGLNVFFKLGAV